MTKTAEDLQRLCRRSGDLGQETVEWIVDPENAGVVKAQAESLSRRFRRHVVECRKMEATVVRPMALGVFGESQTGKSYLVDRLISRAGEPAKVLFDGLEKPLYFVPQINPEGGGESTAIATRFSVRREAQTPPGFPVIVRLLSIGDLAQIVGDIYYTGFDIKEEAGFSGVQIDEALNLARSSPSSGGRAPIRQEDLWSIRDFFHRKHSDKPNIRALETHDYWRRAEEILAKGLDVHGLVALFGTLWGGVEGLSDLFRRCVTALAALGFEETLYCPLETLVERTGEGHARHPKSIIATKTLESLLVGGDDDLLRVAARSGAQASVGRAMLGALVAELRLTIEPGAWGFLQETDLIDFPGLRSPEVVGDFRSGLKKDPQIFGRVFKDAKVRYLFERFKVERELSGLILCLDQRVPEVAALPGLIKEWIASTHGATPQERLRSKASLFVVLTKFDAELVGKPNDRETPSERWQERLRASLLDRYAAQSDWVNEWTPGRPFTNVFWFRNPNMRNPGVMDYASSTSNLELGVRASERERFEVYLQGYLAAPYVRKYVAEPKEAWEAVFQLNDGGLTRIVEHLSAVLQSSLKLEQIAARIAERRADMRHDLESRGYYVASDAASRIRLSQENAVKVLEAVIDCASQKRLNRLLSALQVRDAGLRERFQEVARRESLKPRIMDPNALREAAGLSAGEAGKEAGLADKLALSALEHWIGAMRDFAEDDRAGGFLSMPREPHELLVDELILGAERVGLQQEIAAPLRRIVGRAAPLQSGLAKAALIASNRINAFVMRLGYDAMDSAKRPKSGGAGGGPVFAPQKHRGVQSLTEEPDAPIRQFTLDWLAAYRDFAERNAHRVKGADVNLRQNERLGRILGELAA